MIKIYVLPESVVKNQDMGDSLVISITSPGREHPIIKGGHVFQFHFHDVVQIYELSDGRIFMPMSETIAEMIAEIAVSHMHYSKWIIHCEAGISRSPGVAIGLSKYLKFEPNRRMLKKMFPLYNKHVCRLVEHAMEMKVGELIPDKE